MDVRSADFKKTLAEIEKYKKKLEDAAPAAEKLIVFKAELNTVERKIAKVQSDMQEAKETISSVSRTLSDYDKIREGMLQYLLEHTYIQDVGSLGSRSWVLRKKTY